MHRINNFIIVSVISLVLLASCDSLEKRLDYEDQVLPTSPVVNSFPTEGDSVTVSLTLSQSILEAESEFQNLADAEVVLKENGQVVSSTNVTDFDGDYVIQHEIQSGRNYSIDIDHPSYSGISATTYIPNEVSQLQANGEEGEEEEVRITISFDDTPDADYYQLILLNGDNIEGWYTSSEYFDIDPFEGESYFQNYALFTDEAFRNGTAELTIETFLWYFYDPDLKIVVYSCSEDYFTYMKSKDAWLQTDGDGLFSQPVQIYSNVDNGLGIFGGYSSAEVEVEF